MDKDKATKIWRQRVDFSAFLYVGLLTTLCCIKVALDIIYDDDTDYDDIYSGEQGRLYRFTQMIATFTIYFYTIIV